MIVIAALPGLDTCVESGSFETASIHDVEAVNTLHLASSEATDGVLFVPKTNEQA